MNDQVKNYYNILGIDKNATTRQMRRCVWIKGKRLHPKKAQSSPATLTEFIEILEAYSVLSNTVTKMVYDWLIEDEILNNLSDEATLKHRRTIEIASYHGLEQGNYYSKASFWEFRHDFYSFQWWNWVAFLPW